MQGTCIKTVNIRDGSESNLVVGRLNVDDVVYGEVRLFNGLDRLFFTKIYRETGSIDIWAIGSNSAVKDAYNVWLKLADVPEPGTEPPPPPVSDIVSVRYSGEVVFDYTDGRQEVFRIEDAEMKRV